jgi:archaellum biogenesis protein FlaJ (TadC family)
LSTETFYAVLAGFIIGLLLGLLKAWLLWYRRNPFKAKANARKTPGASGIMARTLLSYFFNIIILGLLYLARPLLPLPLIPLLLATATGLLVCGLIYPLQNMLRK